MKYLLQFDNVLPDPGIEKAEQIEQIVRIVEGGSWELTALELKQIEGIRARLGTRFCRQCEYCMPCPKGVRISGVRYLPILYEAWPREWFLSWDDVRSAVESAAHCVRCGECEKKCPYHLPIRGTIAEHLDFHERVKA